MHRTANGKAIDMQALRTKNEHVRAVGNMNVNARGDVIDSNNQVINDNNRRMNAMYNKTTQRVPNAHHAPPAAHEHAMPDDFDNDVVIIKK